MENVLVLNANYEPINVCTSKRAICLILMQKANLVADGRGEIKTVNISYPHPSIIRLQKMIQKPRSKIKLTRKEVFRRDGYICQYCGQSYKNLTIDHVIPKHLGGEHVWSNVVTACSHCNHIKGGRTLNQSNMQLVKIPSEPPSSAFYIYNHYLNIYQDWEPFLTGW